ADFDVTGRKRLVVDLLLLLFAEGRSHIHGHDRDVRTLRTATSDRSARRTKRRRDVATRSRNAVARKTLDVDGPIHAVEIVRTARRGIRNPARKPLPAVAERPIHEDIVVIGDVRKLRHDVVRERQRTGVLIPADHVADPVPQRTGETVRARSADTRPDLELADVSRVLQRQSRAAERTDLTHRVAFMLIHTSL